MVPLTVNVPEEVELKVARVAGFLKIRQEELLLFAVIRMLEVQGFVLGIGGDEDVEMG